MSVVSEVDQSKRLGQIAERAPFGPLGNGEIWLVLIAATNLRRPKQPFLESERDRIVDTYIQYGEANLSVEDLAREAGVVDLGRNRFLNGVCFNYTHQLGAADRHERVMRELETGLRERIDLFDKDIVSVNTQVDMDFQRPLNEMYRVNRGARFNQETKSLENYYGLSGHYYYPSRTDRIISTVAHFIPFCWPFLGYCSPTSSLSWEFASTIASYWSENALPLLGNDELLKPGTYPGRPSYIFQPYPTIVKRDSAEMLAVA